MQQSNDVLVTDDVASTRRRELLRRHDDPVVVAVVVWVAGDLLTLTTDATIVVFERVLIRMRVEEALRATVLQEYRVVVPDLCALTGRT